MCSRARQARCTALSPAPARPPAFAELPDLPGRGLALAGEAQIRTLLYLPEGEKRHERPERGERGERAADADRAREPTEGTAWCEGYMSGVKLRDDEWQALYDAADARDWIFPIEALAFGDHDPEFAEWIDDKDKRDSLVDELPVAAVLIYRYWQERRRGTDARSGGKRPTMPEIARKSRQRLH